MGARISNFMEWEGAWSTLRSAWPQARCVSTILAAKKGHIAGKLSRIAMLRLELRLLKSSIIIIFCISINDIIIIIIMISQLDHLSTSLFHALALHHSTAWCPQLPWHWYQSSRKHLGASVTEWVGVLQTWELYNICVCVFIFINDPWNAEGAKGTRTGLSHGCMAFRSVGPKQNGIPAKRTNKRSEFWGHSRS